MVSLKFVEMAEISAEDPPNPTPGHPAPPKRPITDISQWLEKYSVMAAALTVRFPEGPRRRELRLVCAEPTFVPGGLHW